MLLCYLLVNLVRHMAWYYQWVYQCNKMIEILKNFNYFRKSSPTGNRTLVVRVTGGNTHHYTIEETYEFELCDTYNNTVQCTLHWTREVCKVKSFFCFCQPCADIENGSANLSTIFLHARIRKGPEMYQCYLSANKIEKQYFSTT